MIHEPTWKPTRAQRLAARGKTIRDVIAPNLSVLFCGINPGLYTAAIGHHFARPGNRFWPALVAAGFTPELFSPFDERHLFDLKIGITNVVSHATATADEVTRDELRAGAKKLVAKVKKFKPRVLAIVGIGAYRVAFDRPDGKLGLQDDTIGSLARVGIAKSKRAERALSTQTARKIIRRVETVRGEIGTSPAKIRFTKRKIFCLTIALQVAVGWICYSRAQDRSAIRTSLIWSRLNPIPASASELGIKISGSFFTRDFELDFTLGAADLNDWLAQSPGIKDAKLSTDAGWTVYWIKPGGGAQFAELRVDRATGKVRLHTYWS